VKRQKKGDKREKPLKYADNEICSCCKKIKFCSEISAECHIAIRSSWKNKKFKSNRLYYSEECDCWHVTSQIQYGKEDFVLTI